LLKLGYYDGLKFIKKLDGRKYYIKKTAGNEITNKLDNVDVNEIKQLVKLLKIKLEIGKMINQELKQKILPILLLKTKNLKSVSTKETIMLILEYVAEIEKVDRFKIYEFEEFVNILKEKAKTSKNINATNKVLYKFIEAI